jgi:hypothetical protein
LLMDALTGLVAGAVVLAFVMLAKRILASR